MTDPPTRDRRTDPITVTGDAPHRRVTLVMLSAGVDSTHALARLLRESDDEIFAHHVHFINEEGRHEIEAERARALVAKLREIRHFNYSETAIDHRNMRWFGFDIMGVGFEAGICAHSFHRARGRPMDRWTIGTCLEEGHDEARFAHVENVVAANCWPEPAPRFHLAPMIPKAEEIAWLGAELASLCWTCRRPKRLGKGWAECGRCKTCRLMAKIAPPQSEGAKPA